MHRHVHPAHEHGEEEEQHRYGEEKPQLLRAYREYEVGMRLGKVVLLLHRLVVPHSGYAAVADRDYRLLQLVVCVARSLGPAVALVAVEPRHAARPAVRVEPHKRHDHSKPREAKQDQMPDLRPCQEHQREPNGKHHHGRPVVRLQDKQHRDGADNCARCHRAAQEARNPEPRPLKPHRHAQDGRQLRQLAGLKAHGHAEPLEVEPPVRPVDLGEGEHHPQQHKNRHEKRYREPFPVAPVVVVEHNRRRHHKQGHDKPHRLALHEEVRVVVERQPPGAAGARKHHDADRHERRRHKPQYG